jgi:benzoyl-CoA reductase/2-hydroxyglutaryl-CoA dehydratase subunit BcrC/BadD/HgdB
MMQEVKEKTTATKSTETVKKVRPLLKQMYRKAHEAKEGGRPIAYCMGLSMCDEILKAMDIVPIFPEHYAGLCSAKRANKRFLEESDGEGFSNVICGYARNGLGFDSLRYKLGEIPPDSPDGGMPSPDILLPSSRGCDTSLKWFQALGRYLDAPIYNIEVLWPPKDADIKSIKERYIRYAVKELEGLVAFLERHTGEKLDWDQLESVIAIADETLHFWWEVSQLRKAVPCPMPSEDHANAMVPQGFFLGTQEALDFHKELYSEVKYRVDNKIGVIPEEKYRLMWGIGLPPWHSLNIFNYFESHGAVGVIEGFYRIGSPGIASPKLFDIPTGISPLEHIARRYFGMWSFNHAQAQKDCGEPIAQYMLDWIDDYQIDGYVEHMSTSCRLWSLGQLHYSNVVRRYRKDLPFLMWSSDMVDLGTFSEADVKTQIDAFIEVLNTHKTAKLKPLVA